MEQIVRKFVNNMKLAMRPSATLYNDIDEWFDALMRFYNMMKADPQNVTEELIDYAFLRHFAVIEDKKRMEDVIAEFKQDVLPLNDMAARDIYHMLYSVMMVCEYHEGLD